MSTRRAAALALFALAACGGDRTPAPVEPTPLADLALSTDVLTLATAGVNAAAPRGLVVDGVPLDRLPAELRLTDAQRAQAEVLVRAFAEATRADAAAVADAARRAEAAMRAGRPAAEVRAILEEATPARRRLDEAARALTASLLGVLTPAQRAWVEAQRPPRCDRATAPVLTAEQAARVRALQEAHLAATRADRDALAKILADAMAARQAGKPASEVLAILEKAAPIRDRLAAAEAKLRADLDAVLTAEQRASRCPFVLPPAAPR
jgi:Spy/CpxP family protein refolding chaperone